MTNHFPLNLIRGRDHAGYELAEANREFVQEKRDLYKERIGDFFSSGFETVVANNPNCGGMIRDQMKLTAAELSLKGIWITRNKFARALNKYSTQDFRQLKLARLLEDTSGGCVVDRPHEKANTQVLDAINA